MRVDQRPRGDGRRSLHIPRSYLRVVHASLRRLRLTRACFHRHHTGDPLEPPVFPRMHGGPDRLGLSLVVDLERELHADLEIFFPADVFEADPLLVRESSVLEVADPRIEGTY